MIDRRTLLGGLAAGTGAGMANTLAAPALASGNERLVMVTSWGRGLAGAFDAAQMAAETINRISDGAIEVVIHAAGELVGAFEVFDAVAAGEADMYHAAEYYFLDKHPAFAFFAGVPFGMTAVELNNWYYHGKGGTLHRELAEPFGLRSFLAGNTGAQPGGWFRRPIEGPEDFKDLKFRMPGLGGKALGRLGASVQNIPGSEVFRALASGALDGTEWIGPWADETAGFHKITRYYYTAGFHEPTTAFSLAVNKDRFDALKPAHQAIIETAASHTNQWSLSQFLWKNGDALARLQDLGVETLEFTPEIWSAFGEATGKVYAEHMGDERFAGIHASFADSMRKSSAWLTLSDGVYRRQRDRILAMQAS